ncbi:hypothetical protein G6F57_017309 [Rhizopus arrhizus]|nr:hypothetical protein G6F57_017309 [Rhizopus arrhizus]
MLGLFPRMGFPHAPHRAAAVVVRHLRRTLDGGRASAGRTISHRNSTGHWRDLHRTVEGAGRNPPHQCLSPAVVGPGPEGAAAGAVHARRWHRRRLPACGRAGAGTERQRQHASIPAGRHREHRTPPRHDRPQQGSAGPEDRAAHRWLGGLPHVPAR